MNKTRMIFCMLTSFACLAVSSCASCNKGGGASLDVTVEGGWLVFVDSESIVASQSVRLLRASDGTITNPDGVALFPRVVIPEDAIGATVGADGVVHCHYLTDDGELILPGPTILAFEVNRDGGVIRIEKASKFILCDRQLVVEPHGDEITAKQ